VDLDNPFRAEMDGKGQNWTVEALDHLMANIGATWTIQHDIDGTHRYFDDDANGITIEPSPDFDGTDHAYRFDVETGLLGIIGSDSEIETYRRVGLISQWDGVGAYTSVISLIAKYNPTTGTSKTAEMTMTADDGLAVVGIEVAGVATFTLDSDGNVSLVGTSIVIAGATRYTSNVDVDGTLNVDGTVNIEGATEVDDTLTVTGVATFNNTVSRGTAGAGNQFWALTFNNNEGLISLGASVTTTAYLAVFSNNNGDIGSISISGTTTAYNTTSDAHLKRDLGVAKDTRLGDLKVRDYEWLADNRKARGVFAQEAFASHPEAVTPGDGGRPWMVDYSKFVPDLIVGWQAHEARLRALETR
jgi:hypothetical protein